MLYAGVRLAPNLRTCSQKKKLSSLGLSIPSENNEFGLSQQLEFGEQVYMYDSLDLFASFNYFMYRLLLEWSIWLLNTSFTEI